MNEQQLGQLAYAALIEELQTAPKPGLVDPLSNGAHTDMDAALMEKSARTLKPYFVRMAQAGFQEQGSERELFACIRQIGIEAEKAMFQATGGVNTHKGMIFTLGIWCTCAARCLQCNLPLSEQNLLATEQKMVREELLQELATIRTASSHGTANYLRYGTGGIRQEAAEGYPALFRYACPTLAEGKKQHQDWNRVKLQTLMVLMANVEDSNIISRHDPGVLAEVQQEAAAFLQQGGAYTTQAEQELERLDRSFTERRISPGGSADLLGAGIFLDSLMEKPA